MKDLISVLEERANYLNERLKDIDNDIRPRRALTIEEEQNYLWWIKEGNALTRTISILKRIDKIQKEICYLIDSDVITMSRGAEILQLQHIEMRKIFNEFKSLSSYYLKGKKK